MSRWDKKAAFNAFSGPQRTTSECRPCWRSNLVVLQRVNDVETIRQNTTAAASRSAERRSSSGPASHFDWEKVEGSFDREPRAQRRQGQSQTEENVREIREAFGQR